MNERIVNCIKRKYEEKTLKGDPNTNTDLANSLDILSSGIYTEEERFVFELLQNAVDAFDSEEEELRIKVVVKDGYVIFMHNGVEFSERDIEGICSVGDGEKASDIKKIGYKGIGFKSVFMHSEHVSIQTGDTIFGFNKSHWNDFYGSERQSSSGRTYKMPWQTIPILEEEQPISIDTEGYNVITYLRVTNIVGIASKMEGLMSDCRFLLFLRHGNIIIDYETDGGSQSVSKHSKIVRTLAPMKIEQRVSLAIDGYEESRWLVYKNENVPVPSDMADEINSDTRTPEKLKGVQSYDMSFAIRLDDKDGFVPLENAVLYTYLPTSCHVQLPFLTNANFITDAGRQQLNIDAHWNHMAVSAMPLEFIDWISKLSGTHKDYYKILPSESLGIEGLEEYYKENLKKALSEVAFVPALSNQRLLTVGETIYDGIELKEGLEEERFNLFIKKQFGSGYSTENLIDPKAGAALKKHGSQPIDRRALGILLEQANETLASLSIDECVKLCKWLSKTGEKDSANIGELGPYPFLIDENNNLATPDELFFPSYYRKYNSFAESAKVIHEELMKKLEEEGLKDWLTSIGVKEFSDKNIIENVICSRSFFENITKDEGIAAIRFIFRSKLIDKLDLSTLRWRLRFLNNKGDFMHADDLFLNLKDYGIGIDVDFDNDLDIFISNEYIREGDDKLEWAMFLKKLNVNDKFQLVFKWFEKDTELWEKFSDLGLIDQVCKKEYNVSQAGWHYYYNRDTISICVTTIPLLSISNNNYDVCRMVWNNILYSQISLDKRNPDHFNGKMGMYYYDTNFKSSRRDYNYLEEPFLSYALKNFNWLPGTDGKLYRVTELLDNSPSNRELCGKYFPALNVDCKIDESWNQYLPFKHSLTLDDCLIILGRIYEDAGDGIKENQDRISLIYQYISNNFTIERGDSNYARLAKWGESHKILTSNKMYKYPNELFLVDEVLGKIDIADQVFCGRHVGSRDKRFVHLMEALGVTFVNSFTPLLDGDDLENREFKKNLLSKSGFLTLLALGKGLTKDEKNEYDSEFGKVKSAINSFSFVRKESIKLSYANQEIEKKVYVSGDKFYYRDSLSISNLEMMIDDIADKLGISKSDRTVLMTVIQINELKEICDYLEDKGYETSFVTAVTETDVVWIGVDSSDNSLSGIEQIENNEEARKVVKDLLDSEGFDTTHWEHVFSSVNGVTKDEVEYPLVVKSYKNSKYPLRLNPNELLQLFNENSMLLLHRGNRVVARATYSELFGNQDKISLWFSPDALRNMGNMKNLAELLKYFNECHFDRSGLNITRYESMRDYRLGQNNPNAFLDLSPDDLNLID
ncbi:MAG: hypothetical protein LUD72_06530 [Bacteroidales bacterium]|nr:hypothetical protein [Bacteroidales bacterium]